MTIDFASLQSRDGARRVFAGPGGGTTETKGCVFLMGKILTSRSGLVCCDVFAIHPQNAAWAIGVVRDVLTRVVFNVKRSVEETGPTEARRVCKVAIHT